MSNSRSSEDRRPLSPARNRYLRPIAMALSSVADLLILPLSLIMTFSDGKPPGSSDLALDGQCRGWGPRFGRPESVWGLCFKPMSYSCRSIDSVSQTASSSLVRGRIVNDDRTRGHGSWHGMAALRAFAIVVSPALAEWQSDVPAGSEPMPPTWREREEGVRERD